MRVKSLKANEWKPVKDQSAYQGNVLTNFGTSRQWVAIKLFALRENADDRAARELLLRPCLLQSDSYAGTGDKDMIDIYGALLAESNNPGVLFAGEVS